MKNINEIQSQEVHEKKETIVLRITKYLRIKRIIRY